MFIFFGIHETIHNITAYCRTRLISFASHIISNISNMMNSISSHRIDSRTLRSQASNNVEIVKDWKSYYLSKNPWLCDIPNDFILDSFNIYGLCTEFEEKTKCRSFQLCLDVITRKLKLDLAQMGDIVNYIPVVYGMIHNRFLLTQDGMSKIEEKYNASVFGVCPRIYCRMEKLLPIGLSSELGKSKVKVFCPCCREVYEPSTKVDLDGAYFGPNMVHIFMDDLVVDGVKIVDHRKKYEKFCRRAFGFRVRVEESNV